jgi:DNA-binding CsgD family transcriptional regulator
MGDARAIILPPDAVGGDDLGLRRAFELFVITTKACWAELVIRSSRSAEKRTLRFGTPEKVSHTAELELGENTSAVLKLAGCGEQPQEAFDALAEVLTRELQRLRLLAESTLLRGALDATAAAILLFGPTGTILYANRRADELISRQTEDELTVTVDDVPSQPLFELLCAEVGALLMDTERRTWNRRLDLSDGRKLTGELEALATGADGLGRIILAVLRDYTRSPYRRVEDFAAHYRLSPREREVLLLLIQGLDTASLADRLGISPHTVRDHLKNVFRKTSNRSRSELMSALTGATDAPES